MTADKKSFDRPRLTRISVSSSNADAFIAFFENIKSQLQCIPGFLSGDIVQTNNPADDNTIGYLRNQGNPDEVQMLVIAQYDCKASADASIEEVRKITLPAIATFATAESVIREGESLWSLY